MNDELRFLINIGVNDQSVAETLDKMRRLDEEIADIFKQGAAKDGKGVTDVIREMGEEQEKTSVKFKDASGGMVELNKQIHEYRAELKDLNKETKDSSELTDEQAQRKTELQLALKAASGEFNKQTRETIAMNAGAKDAIVTYNDLTARNRALAAEMKNVPLDDTTGKLAALKGEYAANNETLKEFDKSIGNNQRNVGNYEEAITGALGQLGPFGKAIQSTIVGLRAKVTALRATGPGFATATTGARAFMVALVATGIGAIVVALGALLAIMMKIEPVTRRLEAATAALGVAIGVVADRVRGLLSGFRDLLQGNFSEGVDKMRNSFTGLASEVRDATAAKYDLVRASQALNDREVALMVPLQALRTQYAQLREASRDYTKSEEERQKLLEEAINIERARAALEEQFAKDRLQNILEQNKLTINDISENKEAAEAQVRVMQIQEQSAQRLMRISAELSRMRARNNEEVVEQTFTEIDAVESVAQRTIDVRMGAESKVLENARKRREQEKIEEEELLRIKQELAEKERIMRQEQANAIALIATNSVSAIFGESKVGAIAQALINTYQAATNALANIPAPLNIPAAAAVTAAGLRNVASIRSTNLGGSGGSSGGSGAMTSAARPGARTGSGPSQRFASTQQQPNKPMIINVTGNVDREGIAWAVRRGEQIIESGQVVST